MINGINLFNGNKKSFLKMAVNTIQQNSTTTLKGLESKRTHLVKLP